MSNRSSLIIGGVAAVVLYGSIYLSLKTPGTPKTEKATKQAAEQRVDSMIDAAKKYARENPYVDIEDRVNALSLDAYPNTKDGVLAAVEEMETLRGRIGNALADTAYVAKAKKWRATMIKKQVEMYPPLRGRWALAAGKLLWENDIEVEVSGKANTIVTLTGGTFAANKNKADTQERISEVLQSLRFKQSRYKWYEGDDTYTYYKMQTPGDAEF